MVRFRRSLGFLIVGQSKARKPPAWPVLNLRLLNLRLLNLRLLNLRRCIVVGAARAAAASCGVMSGGVDADSPRVMAGLGPVTQVLDGQA
jgi:hypothetical protein